MDTRIGFGYDSHEFKAGVPLHLGGMALDHPEGLAGHSDGDVMLHAITDALLGVDIDQVSIKAKTPEGLGLEHVAQCHAVALVERVQEPEELKSMSEVIESQRQLEDVVDDLLSSVHGVPKRRTINPVYDTEDIT